MHGTKEKILLTALRLFARDGYEAVSVSDIAGELGITKAALYRHYANKRAILESIVERMERRDAEQARDSGVPEGSRDTMEERYRGTSVEAMTGFGKAMFRYWTQDAFAAPFRRMLTLEQFRDPEMGRLYQQYLAPGRSATCATSSPPLNCRGRRRRRASTRRCSSCTACTTGRRTNRPCSPCSTI